MANITLRTTKGSPLTTTELDNNFTSLNTDIASRVSQTGLLSAILLIDGAGSGLDADLIDGMNATALSTPTSVVSRDASGNFAAAGITASSLTSTGGLAVTGSQTLVGATLGAVLGNQTLYQRYQSTSTNVDYLEITNTRTSAGSDWTTAGTRLQEKVDSTWMSYIQFNGVGNQGGISIGAGTTTINAISIPEAFRINASGNVGIGTNSPLVKLHTSSTTGNELRVETTSSGLGNVARINLKSPYSNYGFFVADNLNYLSLYDYNANVERIRVDNGGNIGVNTIPSAKFHTRVTAGNSFDGILVDNATSTLRLAPSLGAGSYNGLVQAGDTGIIFGGATAGTGQALTIAPWLGASSGLRMTNNGWVGINTITPASSLDVNGYVTLSLADNYIKAATTTNQISINGGTGFGAGGQITLRGSTSASNPGGIDFIVGTGPVLALTINNAGVTTVPTGYRIQGTDVGSIRAPGMILQVVNTTITVASALATSATYTTFLDIPAFNVVITPKYANSKMYIKVSWFGEWAPTSGSWDSLFGIKRNGTPINYIPSVGAAQGLGISTLSYNLQDASSTPETATFETFDSPGVTTAVTYQVCISSTIATTLFTNRTVTAGNTSGLEAAPSLITIMEIAQ